MWAGAVPDREQAPPHSPCDSFYVQILVRFSSFLLLPQRGFPEVFSGFVGFGLFCLPVFCVGFVLRMKGSVSLRSSELPPRFWNNHTWLSPVPSAEPPRVSHSAAHLLFPWSPEPPQLLQRCGTFRESPSAFPGAF